MQYIKQVVFNKRFFILVGISYNMGEIVTVGEKGQIVIPKQMRDYFHIEKGTKLLVKESEGTLILSPVELNDKHLFMLASESSLKKIWDNPYDERWDDVL